MQTLEAIKTKLLEIKPYLQRTYHITELGVFGSYVRGEQTSESDIDVLVEFDPSFRFGLSTYSEMADYISEMADYISDTLGGKVDLVMKRALKPYIGKQILKEVIYLWSSETFETTSTTS